jgi:Zn finger protein HypA/HybF involved in hydrogenase expression
MASAFERIREECSLGDSTLHIEPIPLQARCEDCQTVFMPERFHFVCPSCGSRDTTATQGDTVILESIELNSNATDATS